MIALVEYYIGRLLEKIATLLDTSEPDDYFWDFDEREEL